MKDIVRFKDIIEESLQKIDFPSTPKNLYEPIKYILSLEAKRIRSIALLIAHNLYNKDYTQALSAALAIEMFHNFTLIHDDIMDKASLRRNSKTVHEKWDDNIAILSGDALLVKSYMMLSDINPKTRNKVIDRFSNAAMIVCEGQQMDIDFSNTNDVSAEKYLKMIEYKTAVLLGASMKMGAIVSHASLQEQNSIYEFGRNLGMAFQIQDDFLDTFGEEEKFGKMIGGDILENKKTLLFIRAKELLSEKDSSRLIELYSSKSLDDHSKINEVKELYNKCGIPEIMMKEIKQFTLTAFKMLENINISAEKQEFLINFGNSLMKRNI